MNTHTYPSSACKQAHSKGCCQQSTYNCSMVCTMLLAVDINTYNCNMVCTMLLAVYISTYNCMMVCTMLLAVYISTYNCTMVCAMLSAVYIQLHHGMHYAVGCLHKYIQLHHGVCYAVSGLHTTAPWCVLCCQLSTYNRRFPEITGKDNLTVFSYSGRVKSPEWRRQMRRADLRQF